MAKSKQTKMKEISFKTKWDVMERQGNRSLTGIYLSHPAFHHVVQRGSGRGVGIAFNIVALTYEEHDRFHQHLPITVHGEEMSWLQFKLYMEDYLKRIYPHWSEEACNYHPGWDEQDYWDAIEGKKK